MHPLGLWIVRQVAIRFDPRFMSYDSQIELRVTDSCYETSIIRSIYLINHPFLLNQNNHMYTVSYQRR